MKHGKTLNELAAEITRQAASKKDYLAPSSRLHMTINDGAPQLIMQNGSAHVMGITPIAHQQIAGRLDIPRSYYDRMKLEHPQLLAENVNTWLGRADTRYLVRTLDNNARALLSDKYRAFDNFDLAETVLPKLLQAGCRVESCELTDSRLYIKAVTPRLSAEVKKGDVVQAGLMITNSEVGHGAIKIEPLIYRLVCSNGAVINDMAMRKNHVGRRSSQQFFDMEDAAQYYRDETRMADDRAFWMKVSDVVSALLDEVIFQKIVSRWREAADQKITIDPIEVVERTAKRYNLSDGERGGVLMHLIQGGDLSAYGLMNAVTRMAQDVESYDRSTEMERLGPEILELPRQAWAQLATI